MTGKPRRCLRLPIHLGNEHYSLRYRSKRKTNVRPLAETADIVGNHGQRRRCRAAGGAELQHASGNIVISGTPTAAGNFPLTLTATDPQFPLSIIVPFRVDQFASNVTAIDAGSGHTCAVVDGGVQCWGGNGNGQLGNNSVAARSTFNSTSRTTVGKTQWATRALSARPFNRAGAKLPCGRWPR